MFRRTALQATITALSLTLLSGVTHAADSWPSKPLKIIVGFSAGSSPDVQARLIAEPLSKLLAQPVVVENRPGASGNLGAAAIAKATDGHTFGIIGNGPLTSSKFLYRNLPYDPQQDFAPIALVGAAPLVWVIAKDSKISTAAQFIAHARAQGEKIAYGSVGVGSGTHLAVELLKPALGIQPLHIPYNGGPSVVTALAGGEIHMALLPASTAQPLIDADKITAIAATSRTTSPLAPTLHGMEDIGAQGVHIEVWNAVMAPASMPHAHQHKLAEAVRKVVESEDVRQKLLEQGWRVENPSAAALFQRMEADTQMYKTIIEKEGIQLD